MKLLRFVIFTLFLLCASIGRATITAETNRTGPYTMTVLPATVSVVFPYQQASDLLVLDLGASGTANDPPVVLTLNSDYTVTGGGYNPTTQMQSGNVVLVTTGAHGVQINDQIIILRNVPVNQTSSLVSGVLTAAAIEKALDKQATISQRLTETVGRGLRFEPGEVLDGTMLRSARAGKTLGFDAQGNILFGPGGGGAGTTYTAGTGLNLVSNVFAVNPAQSFTDLTVTNVINGSISGTAARATILATAQTINGVAFDGSAPITVAAAAGTLTGTALPAAITSAPGLVSGALGTFGSMSLQNSSSVAVTGGSINGAVVTGLATPSASSDAVNKAYADAISAGAVPRTAVLVASTGNLTLSGPQTIDGQSVVATNRVLVKNQTLPAQNGIYDCAAGAWTRSSDSNTAGQLLKGYYYFVGTGTTQASTSWFIATAPTVLNTDPVVFSQYSAANSYTAGAGLALAANQFSVSAAQPGITSLGTLSALAVNGPVSGTGFTAYFSSPPAFGNVAPASVAATTLSATGATSITTLLATGIATYDLGTASGALPPEIVPGSTAVRLGNVNGSVAVIQADIFGSAVGALNFAGRSIGNTRAAPQATPSGYQMVRFNGYGYDTGYTTTANVAFFLKAMSLWTTGSHETGFGWNGTPSGTTTMTGWMSLDAQNGLSVLSTLPFKSPNENKLGYMLNTTAIVAYDSSSGGLYTGFQAGAGVIRSVIDNSGNPAPLSVQVGNGTQIGIFTTTGLGITGVMSVDTNPHKITTKSNFNLIEVNVLDYGADPSGVGDSSAALTAAIAAVPSVHGVLLLPPGRYNWAGAGSLTISGKTNFTIQAEGAELYDNNTLGARPFFVIDKTCSYVKVIGLHLNCNATSRVAGAHQFILNASHSQVDTCSFTNGSQFTFYIGSDSSFVTTDVTVSNCQIFSTWADGFHVFNVLRVVLSDCSTDTTFDDGIGIGSDDGSHFPSDVTLNNFNAIQAGFAAGGGTHGASIRIFDGAKDVKIYGGSSTQGAETGIAMTRSVASNGLRNARIKVVGFNSYKDAAYASGGRLGEGIDIQWSDYVTLNHCTVNAPTRVNTYGIAILDANNLNITGCDVHSPGVRGIGCDDGTSANVAASWTSWFIGGNTVDGTCTAESIYLETSGTPLISNVVIGENKENVTGSFRSIFTNHITTSAKVANNTRLGTRAAPASGGTVAGLTAVNNN